MAFHHGATVRNTSEDGIARWEVWLNGRWVGTATKDQWGEWNATVRTPSVLNGTLVSEDFGYVGTCRTRREAVDIIPDCVVSSERLSRPWVPQR